MHNIDPNRVYPKPLSILSIIQYYPNQELYPKPEPDEVETSYPLGGVTTKLACMLTPETVKFCSELTTPEQAVKVLKLPEEEIGINFGTDEEHERSPRQAHEAHYQYSIRTATSALHSWRVCKSWV